MKVTVLGQGYDATSDISVGRLLLSSLSSDAFTEFTAISAFASEAGVLGLSEFIKPAKERFRSLNLIVGVDQHGTSKEALEEIHKLDINSYVFYQKENPIFHPKIYLFEGERECRLIVGSSNLTATGLFSNIESSMVSEFRRKDVIGERVLIEIRNPFRVCSLLEIRIYFA